MSEQTPIHVLAARARGVAHSLRGDSYTNLADDIDRLADAAEAMARKLDEIHSVAKWIAQAEGSKRVADLVQIIGEAVDALDGKDGGR